ncbi:hypothetical protein [Shewanella sp. 10N.286.48.A6]|uniref:hypothetical protein n=1 Tax=Shewanella sp. 10N.286.48.A6 TaxID=1880833 RepID=UPI000C8331FE|nr:hypothetical protein [Shewanella sp. 10N.286.48.A6]PMI02457.1 hypothetical protein BCU55_07065 [Shewanella sp. 10N.286.48.A6]
MSNANKLLQWLQETSFREVTLSVDLLVTGYIFYFYGSSLFHASPEELASIQWVSGIFLEIIIYSVVLMVVSYIALALITDDELSQPMDVREKQINLIGYKYSAIILNVGVILAIVQYSVEANDLGLSQLGFAHAPLHILVVSFLCAELAFYGVQLYKGRTGDIYE